MAGDAMMSKHKQSLTNNNFYFIGLLCGLNVIIQIKGLVQQLLLLTLNYI